MADDPSYMFTEEARSHLQSPDDLERYLHVISPSIWVVLGAVISLLIGLAAWGFFGSVSASISGLGASIDGETLCLVTPNQVAQLNEGDDAYVDDTFTSVASVSPTPLSREEVSKLLGNDYLAYALIKDEWVYVVTFTDYIDSEPGVPLTVNITTERVAPISLILDKNHG